MTREEAIRAIGWMKCTTNREDDLEAIDMAIEALKTDTVSRKDTVTLNSPISIQAEMVAVVRCKDCRWQHTSHKSGQQICVHQNGLVYAVDDNFCSHAERRPK